MLTNAVISHYGSKSAAARALGIGKASVSKWGDLVPPLRAAQYHQKTRGKLKFDPADYIDWYTKPKSSERLPAHHPSPI